ncbi:MAG: hypothetical protein KDK90_24015 [Leptospiraceae bacterium]|nr:hypothetical protein [Leptospiraceae bacterium]
MENKITESEIENYTIELLESQGYQYIYAPEIAPDSETPERESFEDVLLIQRLWNAIERINPHIPTLFTYNGFIVISDGLEAKAGSISAI